MTQIKVMLSGFSDSETSKFQQIFNFSQSRERTYDLNDNNPLLLLTNILNEEALNKNHTYAALHPSAQLVTVGRSNPENQAAHHIAPPYITSRVLRALDQIVIIEIKKATGIQDNKAAIVIDETEEPANQYNVLVVDDSPSMQKMLEIELSQIELNINIDFADTGEEALEKTEHKHYDFIFLDIMMPGIDGYEVCKAIRKKPDEKKTPIIMLSGKTSPLDEVKGVIAGCTTYLTKPIEHIEFQGVIKRIIKWLDHKKPVSQPKKREVEYC